jgi:ubiquinol-cytochrome c reductase cytochrome b subunit
MQKFIAWIDQRFPLIETWEYHMSKYYAPKNFNFWYYFGVLAMVVFVIQILSGLFLTMHYKPDTGLAFASVEYIMRDVPWGWLMRYLHSTGASAFFVIVYLHMFRGLMYGSFRGPRELLWIIGSVIFVALMAEAFFGYLLPWGNMSYWGAQVIISLFGAIPGIGDALSTWIRGDFVVADATLNRFFAFHVIAMPLVLLGLIFVHIVALHHVGSNNPDGIEIKKNKDENGIPKDGVPFHPYYTVHDTLAVVIFLIIFSAVIFFAPELKGWFLEHDNFMPANVLQTPPEIKPLWYLTPFYSILRATTSDMLYVLMAVDVAWVALVLATVRKQKMKIAAIVIGAVALLGLNVLEAKLWGVILMVGSLAVYFVLPWIDRSPVKSVRYRGWMYKLALTLFAVSFVSLGFLGVNPPNGADYPFKMFGIHIGGAFADFWPKNVVWAQLYTVVYFLFFALMPWYTSWDKTKPEPERVR